MTLETKIEFRLLALIRAEVDKLAASQKPAKLKLHAGSEHEISRPPVIVTMATLVAEDVHKTGFWETACAAELRLTKKDQKFEDDLYLAIQKACEHHNLHLLQDGELGLPQGDYAEYDAELERELGSGNQGTDVIRPVAFRLWAGLIDPSAPAIL